MSKNHILPKTILGAAVVGAIVYALFNKKNGKQIRDELQEFLKDALDKSTALGKISRAAYADAVDAAAKMYQESKTLTQGQRQELGELVEDLKGHWTVAQQIVKKSGAKKIIKKPARKM